MPEFRNINFLWTMNFCGNGPALIEGHCFAQSLGNTIKGAALFRPTLRKEPTCGALRFAERI